MIQIINGFKINSDNPIDSRIIVADDATRLAIQYKYHGLRVWQTNTNTPYFWDGTAWKSELDLVVTGDDGDVSVGTVPVFTWSNPVKIGDSIISVTGSRVVIDGDLSFDSITSGSINASLIDTGTMSVSRLQKGNPGQVLQTVGTDVKWKNLSDLTIGKSIDSTNSEKVKIKPVSGVDTDYRLVLRLDSGTIGDNSELFSDSGSGGLILRYKTGSGLRMLIDNGTNAIPAYSFKSSLNTGMYSPSSNTISFSTSGTERVRIDSTGLKTINGTVGSPSYSWIGNTNTGMYRIIDGVNSGIGFSVNGNQRVKITSSSIDFGDVDYSPRIRTGNNTSPTSPSFTWRGNNETGIYRPSQDVIGFSIAGQQAVRITSSYINFGIDSEGSPRIRTGNNTSPTTPSYTWYGNDQTGIYRPIQDVIGFSIAGTERGRFNSSGLIVNGNGLFTNHLTVNNSFFVDNNTVAITKGLQMVKPEVDDIRFVNIDTTGLSNPIPYTHLNAFVPVDFSDPNNALGQISSNFIVTDQLTEDEVVTSPSPSNLPAAPYDRIVTVTPRVEKDVFMSRVYIYVENGINTGKFLRMGSLIDKDFIEGIAGQGDTGVNGNSVSSIIPAGCRYRILFSGNKSPFGSSVPNVPAGIRIVIRKLGNGNIGII